MTRKILDFGARKLDIPAPHLYFQAPGGQCFQLIGINEDRSYHKGAGVGTNVAKEKEAEALRRSDEQVGIRASPEEIYKALTDIRIFPILTMEEDMRRVGTGFLVTTVCQRNNPSEFSTSVPINVLA